MNSFLIFKQVVHWLKELTKERSSYVYAGALGNTTSDVGSFLCTHQNNL